MDTLGIEPRASRMLSGCDTTTQCALKMAPVWKQHNRKRMCEPNGMFGKLERCFSASIVTGMVY